MGQLHYCNINAGIAYLKEFANFNPRVSSKDLVVVVPFAKQAAKWISQLRLQWPEHEVAVVTVGTSQGNAGRLVLFDLTTAHKSEGGALGFLRDFSRVNVAHSRPEDVCLVMCNFDLMRSWLRMIYNSSKPFALYLLDFLDCGDIIDLPPSQSALPVSKAEYESGTFSERQPTAARGKTITGRDNGDNMWQSTPTLFTELEKKYLVELRQLRTDCAANVAAVLEANKDWQREMADKKAARLRDVAMMNEIAGAGLERLNVDDDEIDWEED